MYSLVSLQTPIQMAFDVAGSGGLRICRLIKTSASFPFYLFCNPLCLQAETVWVLNLGNCIMHVYNAAVKTFREDGGVPP